ncbi:hypothetical protein FRC08_009959 [Ceratobasidium sp. 394]|nr:hypothetical protein FRC08_009959 [Ceratobasidium sp. 394]
MNSAAPYYSNEVPYYSEEAHYLEEAHYSNGARYSNEAPIQDPTPGTSTQPVRTRHKSSHMTFQDKLSILDFYHAQGWTQEQTVRHLRSNGYPTFSQSTLSGYLKQEQSIRAYLAANPSNGHLKQRPRVRLPEVEAALWEWVSEKREMGEDVGRLTGAEICDKAREICEELGIPEQDVLKFSNGWLDRLKTRFGLRDVSK